MNVITISRQYGSLGRDVGVQVARALDYCYIDKQLIVMVAMEAGVPVSEVEALDEQPEHPLMWALRKFLAPGQYGGAMDMGGGIWVGPVAFPVPAGQEEELPNLDENAYVELSRKIMSRLADEGRVVLMGRGGQAHLADRPDVLHVRVVAPKDYRVEFARKEEGLGRAEAEKYIQKMDEQRSLYIKRHYGIDWGSPDHYHLIIDANRAGVEGGAKTVVEAARILQCEGTTISEG